LYRKQLGQLTVKIVELAGKILELHQHVNTLTRALDYNGKDYPELLLNLFDAYKKVKDKQFATYIMVTRFGYVSAPDTYIPRTLMNGVVNLYKMRVQTGTWQTAIGSQQVTELAALASRFDSMFKKKYTRDKDQDLSKTGRTGEMHEKRQTKIWGTEKHVVLRTRLPLVPGTWFLDHAQAF
jgi:hypothetical protein